MGKKLTKHGKLGAKCSILADTGGLMLTVPLAAANADDGRPLEAIVDAIPPSRWSPRQRVSCGNGPTRTADCFTHHRSECMICGHPTITTAQR